jgi:hypothetical protein
MKRSIRIDQALAKKAEAIKPQTKRSIAAQVEYWAEMGRVAEERNQPSSERIQALTNFNSNFIHQIQESVQSGEYRRGVLESGYAYEASKMGPGYVDKVFSDERRVTGQVVMGEFVELTQKQSRRTK